MILRVEDIDMARCRPEFRRALIDDLLWFGLRWSEGPDVGGPHLPYVQSARRDEYQRALIALRDSGHIYPCRCSRKDVAGAATAPHDENEEPIYPGTCRDLNLQVEPPGDVNWRFRVHDGEVIRFEDGRLGAQSAIAGQDFGDFVVWRRDDVPAYQLAVVVDDAAMKISEVVRGSDLLISTFRQLLLYRALGLAAPSFYHTPLVTDEEGRRLAKRHASLSLRALRESGITPEEIRARSTSLLSRAESTDLVV